MGPPTGSDRDEAQRRLREVLERLVRDGTAVARADGTLHGLFPVAASTAEGEALRGWVLQEGATRTVEVARDCSRTPAEPSHATSP